MDAQRGFPGAVKCPKCGFVSFPGHEQCKKCGHRFTQVNGEAKGIPPLFHHPAPDRESLSHSETGSALDQTELSGQNGRSLDDATPTVKCPKCEALNTAGVRECGNCGHSLVGTADYAAGISALFDRAFSKLETHSVEEPAPALEEKEEELEEEEPDDLDLALEPQDSSAGPARPPKEEPHVQSPRPHGLSPWQEELAERVQEYRQRRARLHKEEEGSRKNLNFNFGASTSKPEEARPHIIEFPSSGEQAKRSKPKREVRAAPPSFGMGSFESAFIEDEERPSDSEPQATQESPPPPSEPSAPPEPPELSAPPEPPATPALPADTGPLEIELGPSGGSDAADGADELSAVPIARMSMRFYAAMMDTVVLLSAATVFAVVFWQVGGNFALKPLDLVVAALVGAFFVMLYFAGCTAIASATPGLLWAGLEVITFEGNPPRLSDCLWRGLGYIVSMSALMLGFIWAAVDAEGLTWHDRMSRTFIVPADYR